MTDPLDMAKWVDKGLCGHVDNPEVFYPHGGARDKVRTAKAICRQCPVHVECREYALETPDRVIGVWGGLTEDQRTPIRRRRRQQRRARKDQR